MQLRQENKALRERVAQMQAQVQRFSVLLMFPLTAAFLPLSVQSSALHTMFLTAVHVLITAHSSALTSASSATHCMYSHCWMCWMLLTAFDQVAHYASKQEILAAAMADR